MPYALHRTTPDGRERTQGPFKSPAEAGRAASRCLFDNGATNKAGAQRFGRMLSGEALETGLIHAPSGYVFRIERSEDDR